jgi:hypothetical protein
MTPLAQPLGRFCGHRPWQPLGFAFASRPSKPLALRPDPNNGRYRGLTLVRERSIRSHLALVHGPARSVQAAVNFLRPHIPRSPAR